MSPIVILELGRLFLAGINKTSILELSTIFMKELLSFGIVLLEMTVIFWKKRQKPILKLRPKNVLHF